MANETQQQKKEQEERKEEQERKGPEQREPKKPESEIREQEKKEAEKKEAEKEKSGPEKDEFTPTGDEGPAAKPSAGKGLGEPIAVQDKNPQPIVRPSVAPVAWSPNPQVNRMANVIYSAMQGMQQGMTINIFISPYPGMPSPQQQMRAQPMMYGMPQQMGARPVMYGMPQQQMMWQSMAQDLTNFAQMSRTPGAKAAGMQVRQLPAPDQQQMSLFGELGGIIDYVANTVTQWLEELFGGPSKGQQVTGTYQQKIQTPGQPVQMPQEAMQQAPQQPMVDPRRMGGLVNQNLIRQTQYRNQMEQHLKTCAFVVSDKNIPMADKQKIVEMTTGVPAVSASGKKLNSRQMAGVIGKHAEEINADLEKAGPGQLKSKAQELEKAQSAAMDTLVTKDPKTAARLISEAASKEISDPMKEASKAVDKQVIAQAAVKEEKEKEKAQNAPVNVPRAPVQEQKGPEKERKEPEKESFSAWYTRGFKPSQAAVRDAMIRHGIDPQRAMKMPDPVKQQKTAEAQKEQRQASPAQMTHPENDRKKSRTREEFKQSRLKQSMEKEVLVKEEDPLLMPGQRRP